MATNDTQDEAFEAASFGKKPPPFDPNGNHFTAKPPPFDPNGNSPSLAEETSDNAETEEAQQ